MKKYQKVGEYHAVPFAAKLQKSFSSIEYVYCLGQLSAGKMMSVTETKVVCWSSTGQI